jgi:hypothetical protein
MKHLFPVVALVSLLGETAGFLAAGGACPTLFRQKTLFSSDGVELDVDIGEKSQLRSAAAEKFKMLTCTSTACAKKRKTLMMDEYATFGAFYSRVQASTYPEVSVEESPCLGSCQKSPCVAIEHDDFVGTVALEGMAGNELSSSW